jgi:hypothetical protein
MPTAVLVLLLVLLVCFTPGACCSGCFVQVRRRTRHAT